jgi:Protein of unknown function (DUF2934)
MTVEKQDRIKSRAYAIWEESGRPDGLHEYHWHQAVLEIEQEDGAATPESPVQASTAPSLAESKIGVAATRAKRTKPAKTV